jgi:hypothetical protein
MLLLGIYVGVCIYMCVFKVVLTYSRFTTRKMIYCNTWDTLLVSAELLVYGGKPTIIGIGWIKSAHTKNRSDVWYRLLNWADTNIVIFCSGPPK